MELRRLGRRIASDLCSRMRRSSEFYVSLATPKKRIISLRAAHHKSLAPPLCCQEGASVQDRHSTHCDQLYVISKDVVDDPFHLNPANASRG